MLQPSARPLNAQEPRAPVTVQERAQDADMLALKTLKAPAGLVILQEAGLVIFLPASGVTQPRPQTAMIILGLPIAPSI